MPNINLYQAYKRKLRKFGISYGGTEFSASFVDAVNLVFSELNEKVFESDLLQPIAAFDDIIDYRLRAFTSMTFDATADGPNDAIENREFWRSEYEFERTSDTNSFIDTISDDNSDVVISITNGVVRVLGDTVDASFELPDISLFTLAIESSPIGVRAYVDGDTYELEHALGDTDSTQAIGDVSAHVVSSVSGYEFKRARFFTEGTLVYDFLLDSESTGTVSDVVAEYTADLVDAEWSTRYIDPSTPLDFRYSSAFEMGLDFHLQDGGQWAMEPEAERERKWYGRGIRSARSVYQQQTRYISPLNPSGQ